MIELPPFHQNGDAGAHFFALAYSQGRYVAPGGSLNTPAFIVLYFSNSAEFAPFSFQIVSTEGETLSWHRGDDVLRTVEYALLRAGEAERVPVAAWTLYDRSAVEGHSFPDAQTREAYRESRRRMSVMLYRARTVASIAAQLGPIEPLFRHDGTTRLEHDSGPDNEEIWSNCSGTDVREPWRRAVGASR